MNDKIEIVRSETQVSWIIYQRYINYGGRKTRHTSTTNWKRMKHTILASGKVMVQKRHPPIELIKTMTFLMRHHEYKTKQQKIHFKCLNSEDIATVPLFLRDFWSARRGCGGE